MADPRGEIRRIDPEAEVQRLALARQVSAGQVCDFGDRVCDADCEIGPRHCSEYHQPNHRRRHDAGHCDRAWAATEAAGG